MRTDSTSSAAIALLSRPLAARPRMSNSRGDLSPPSPAATGRHGGNHLEGHHPAGHYPRMPTWSGWADPMASIERRELRHVDKSLLRTVITMKIIPAVV